MADTDASSPILRYNLVTSEVEYFQGSDFYPVANADGGITQLTGQVTAGPGSGSQVATVSNAAVIAKVLTGYTSGAGTVAATDTILQAVQKLNGNDALKLPLAGGTVTGATVFNTVVYQPNANPAGTGTVTIDARNAYTAYITVSGALTLNGPSNATDGQKMTIRILNDASHSVTLATGANNFRFGTDIPSYTNSVSLTDYIGVQYNQVSSTWDVVSIIQGF
jgi:hypothetical protein